jgi:hypothetical protein
VQPPWFYAKSPRPKRERMSARDILNAYAAGERDFMAVNADDVDLSGEDLRGASFLAASLRGADLSNSNLMHVQLKAADLTAATLRGATVVASDSIGADFTGTDLSESDLTGASLQRGAFTDAVLVGVNLGSARLGGSDFAKATLDHARLHSTDLSDLNLSSFVNAPALQHGGPSTIDARSVIKSYTHPGIKNFMVDCGVPPIFAEFMIECARATEENILKELMQSTFISYGGPDEGFARKLYQSLRDHQVIVFFFPESARLGERIDHEVFSQIEAHDRVVLVCSQHSLDRPGVLHEIRETFDRESRDGGATYLLPVTLDNYLFEGWKEKEPEFARRIARRVVGDFRSISQSTHTYDLALARLLDAIKVRRAK